MTQFFVISIGKSVENFTPYSAVAGGALIGLSVSLLLLYNGRMAGISGIMNGLFSAPKRKKSGADYFLAG